MLGAYLLPVVPHQCTEYCLTQLYDENVLCRYIYRRATRVTAAGSEAAKLPIVLSTMYGRWKLGGISFPDATRLCCGLCSVRPTSLNASSNMDRRRRRSTSPETLRTLRTRHVRMT